LHEASPNEPILGAEYARLSILLDRNTKEGQRVAQEAFDQAPSEPLCAIAQALSLRSLGRPTDGIDLLRKLPPEKLHEPHTAVYTAVLFSVRVNPMPRSNLLMRRMAGSFSPRKKNCYRMRSRRLNQPKLATPSPSATVTAAPSPTPVDLSPR